MGTGLTFDEYIEHEPLVSLETWNAAQRAVAKRRADAGKAGPTKRTLLASLLVRKRCGHSFTTIRDRRWPGPTGEGYRTYACSGYRCYGKSVCAVTNVPGPALDAFVLQTIKQVLLGDHETTNKAIDAFVAASMAPKAATKRSSKADEREFDLLNRKIKATIAMLADPTFDGLDELRTTLAELKAKRDALQAAIPPAEPPATPALSEKELRTWALEQFARLDELAKRNTIDLKDRQMVEAFVERIEINPETKTGVIYLLADLEGPLLRSSTRGPIGEGGLLRGANGRVEIGRSVGAVTKRLVGRRAAATQGDRRFLGRNRQRLTLGVNEFHRTGDQQWTVVANCDLRLGHGRFLLLENRAMWLSRPDSTQPRSGDYPP